MKNKEIQNLINKALLNPENILLLTVRNKENSIEYQSYLTDASIRVYNNHIEIIVQNNGLYFLNEVEFKMDISSDDFAIDEYEGFEYKGNDYAYISSNGYITFKNSNAEMKIITPKF